MKRLCNSFGVSRNPSKSWSLSDTIPSISSRACGGYFLQFNNKDSSSPNPVHNQGTVSNRPFFARLGFRSLQLQYRKTKKNVFCLSSFSYSFLSLDSDSESDSLGFRRTNSCLDKFIDSSTKTNKAFLRIREPPFHSLQARFLPQKTPAKPRNSRLVRDQLPGEGIPHKKWKEEWKDPDSISKEFILDVRRALKRNRQYGLNN
ncbi:hypothetical protein PSN45_004096 [Yamadazyma tenuis]|uniref:uncharacterized protein n=1 Tax=Candida tenuis TaxID=2315449 RepID=UPI0027AAAFFE|nr:hypothetical protein PSN45_004096 [Yamadazyma tenuis]